MKRIYLGICLIFFFLNELLKANWDVFCLVFKCVFRGPGYLKPAIVRVPTILPSETEVMMLANMITLTPGTLTLEVSADCKNLFVHVIHTESPDDVVQSIKDGFESRIRGVFQ